ncbi:MAG: hypothetical protein R3B90_04510 [Planctomycetaceae bacterium]
MRYYLGMVLQFLALVFLPMLIYWQLQFGFDLIWMPSLLLVGILIFTAGHILREKQ